jgi:hypothetical protein
MNSIEGSPMIPTYVEYTNALIFCRYQFPPFIRTYPKSTSPSFFVPAGTQIGVNRLKVLALHPRVGLRRTVSAVEAPVDKLASRI